MGSDIILIIVLGLLILMSAYFSATETAFSSANRIRLKSMAGAGNKRAALVLKMSDNFDRLLSTILIGNNIVNIVATSLATVLFTRHWGDMGVTLSTVVMTVLVLIFGEISPKKLGEGVTREICHVLSANFKGHYDSFDAAELAVHEVEKTLVEAFQKQGYPVHDGGRADDHRRGGGGGRRNR